MNRGRSRSDRRVEDLAGRIHGPGRAGGRSNPAAADQGDTTFCAQGDADEGHPSIPAGGRTTGCREVCENASGR